MLLPVFTDDEQFLINCVKSPSATQQSNFYMWGYVIGGVLVAGFAAYYQSVPMMLAAFAVVSGFRIYEDRFQSKWTPLWKSIIEKYESAVTGASSDDHSESIAE